jgi:hypothetical protein
MSIQCDQVVKISVECYDAETIDPFELPYLPVAFILKAQLLDPGAFREFSREPEGNPE